MHVEQRVLTALRCEQPDRVPVLSRFNPYVEDWYTHLPSYAEVLAAVERYADVVFNWDFPAPLMLTGGERWIEQRDLGNGRTEQIIHTPDGPITEIARTGWRERRIIKRWIQTIEDAERALSMPYVPHRPDLGEFLSTKARLAGRAVAQATFREPIALANWIDQRAMATWCAGDRGLIRRLLDMTFERIADGLRTCLDAGVGPIYALSRGQPAGRADLSVADFEEFVIEYDRRLVELIHGYDGTYVILQGGGRIGPILERLPAIGMDALNVVEPPLKGDCDLAYVKSRIGDRVCLIANLPYEALFEASTDDMERFVRDALATGAPGGGFMLSPFEIPGERDLSEQASANVIHYLKIARERGRYPLQL